MYGLLARILLPTYNNHFGTRSDKFGILKLTIIIMIFMAILEAETLILP